MVVGTKNKKAVRKLVKPEAANYLAIFHTICLRNINRVWNCWKLPCRISCTKSWSVQLAKDFSLANIPFDLPQGIAPEELKSMLHEKVYVLLLERFSEYLNLLYIIDVPEKAFSTIESSDIVTVSEQVSFLILRREWQKVWLKDKYGSR